MSAAGRVVRTPNPMHPATRQLLDTIAAAGPDGIGRAELRAARGADDKLYKRLSNLIANGYVLQQGKYSAARFVATSKPTAETELKCDAEVLMRAEAAAKTPKGVPPGVPNSVFHMGQLSAEAAAAPAPTPASVMRLGDSFDGLEARGYHVPRFDGEPARAGPGPWRDPPKPTAPQGEVFKPRTPHFELHSDGVLVIDPAGDGTDPITLPPTLTRHLFRWLDCIGGLQLSRLVATEASAADAEATP